MSTRMILSVLACTAALGLALYATSASAKSSEKAAKDDAKKEMAGPLDFTLKNIDGKETPLSEYKGKVILLVNVASKCGFTKQYDALEKVYEANKEAGFVIIGIPANNFGGQEPGTNEEIKQFCSSKFNVTFPMMAKVSVKGDDKTPLYQWLTDDSKNKGFGGEIGWNFTKFLINREGKVVGRYDSKTTPDDAKLTAEMKKALSEKTEAASAK